MPEKLTTHSFKERLQDREYQEEVGEVHSQTRARIRSFVNTQWRKINEEYLNKNSSIKSVRELQEKLQELGYLTEKPDGFYGVNTLAALVKFQRKHNLKTDGIAWSDTQVRILAEIENKTSRLSQISSNTPHTVEPPLPKKMPEIPTHLKEFVSRHLFSKYFNEDWSFNDTVDKKSLMEVTDHSFLEGDILQSGYQRKIKYNATKRDYVYLDDQWSMTNDLVKVSSWDRLNLLVPMSAVDVKTWIEHRNSKREVLSRLPVDLQHWRRGVDKYFQMLWKDTLWEIPHLQIYDSKTRKGLVYFNWNFEEVRFINTGWVLPGKIWKITGFNLSSKPTGSSANKTSATCLGVAFTWWDEMDANWIHMVAKGRSTTGGCVWVFWQTLYQVAHQLKPYATAISTHQTPYKKNGNWYFSEAATMTKYALKSPIHIYVT